MSHGSQSPASGPGEMSLSLPLKFPMDSESAVVAIEDNDSNRNVLVDGEVGNSSTLSVGKIWRDVSFRWSIDRLDGSSSIADETRVDSVVNDDLSQFTICRRFPFGMIYFFAAGASQVPITLYYSRHRVHIVIHFKSLHCTSRITFLSDTLLGGCSHIHSRFHMRMKLRRLFVLLIWTAGWLLQNNSL